MAKLKTSKRGTKRKHEDEDGNADVATSPTLAKVEPIRGRWTGYGEAPVVMEGSRYDVARSGFYQHVDILHSEAFVLKPMIVSDGALAGKSIIVVEPVQHFRFLDLPRELRDIVYGMVFPKGTRLRVHGISRSSITKRLKHRQYGFKSAYAKSSRSKLTVTTLKTEHPTSLSPDLFYVCKQIFREASKVAYDNLTFSIGHYGGSHGHGEGVPKFLCQLGSMLERLRQLYILDDSNLWTSALESMFKDLVGAKRLRVLTIDHGLICSMDLVTAPYTRCKKFVDIIAPAFKRIAAAQTDGDSARVLDIINVKYDQCFVCRCHPSAPCRNSQHGCDVPCGERMDQHCKEMKGTVRTLLVEELGLE